MANVIDELTDSFSRLPGIGKKSAARIVNSLLKSDDIFLLKFANQLSTLKEKMKTMTKSDLKNGMVVEIRNGKRFLIVNDLGIGKDSCITLNGFMGYDENLYDVIGYSEYDITKIYKTEGNTFNNLFDNERLILIWEREETKLSNEDKQIIKKGLKKIQEECKNHKFCVGCMFDDNGHCLLDEIDSLEVDKLFEE